MPLFRFRNLVVEYLEFGSGNQAILCFHGFGRSAADFQLFSPMLKKNQRIISINLFAHGMSDFPVSRVENNPLQPQEWKQLMEEFLSVLEIDRFHLVGYSMGARIAMSTVILMPTKVQSLLLLAPDGFKKNPVNRFASGTKMGRWLFGKLIVRPYLLLSTVRLLNRTGLLNDKLFRFVHVNLDSSEKRKQVYDAWLIYRKIYPDLTTLSALVRERKFSFNMIFGKYDSVIRVKSGRKFCSLVGSAECLHAVELNHKLMSKQTVEYIAEKNLWPE